MCLYCRRDVEWLLLLQQPHCHQPLIQLLDDVAAVVAVADDVLNAIDYCAAVAAAADAVVVGIDDGPVDWMAQNDHNRWSYND